MTGKTCLVTGANSGIGKEVARGLAAKGARVLMVARSAERGDPAREEVAESTGNDDIELLLCDLSSQREIRRLVAEVLESEEHLHLLINNAGLILGRHILTEDKIETTFAVNHLAPFLLTHLLVDRLSASAPARVVTVSSDAHRRSHIDFDDPSSERKFNSMGAYGQSKLANILFTAELARRLDGTGVTATCLHPGVVRTGFGRDASPLLRIFFKLARPFLLTPERGADTAIWLAGSSDVEGASGGYYEKRRLAKSSPEGRDAASAERLWALSEQMTGLVPKDSATVD